MAEPRQEIPPQIHSLEDERQTLRERCDEVTGGKNPILSEVLCFFSEEAELFILTQEHATQIEGKKSLWLAVSHKVDGYGLGGEAKQAGEWEHLGVKGFTGEFLVRQIKVIEGLRGGGYLNIDVTRQIIDYHDRSKEKIELWEQTTDNGQRKIKLHNETNYKMTAKLLEIMKVTQEEIDKLRQYVLTKQTEDKLK